MFKYWSTESIVHNEGINNHIKAFRICSTQFNSVLQLNGNHSMSISKNIEKRVKNLYYQSRHEHFYHNVYFRINLANRWEGIITHDIDHVQDLCHMVNMDGIKKRDLDM